MVLNNSDIDVLKFKEYIFTRVAGAEKSVLCCMSEVRSLRDDLKKKSDEENINLSDFATRVDDFEKNVSSCVFDVESLRGDSKRQNDEVLMILSKLSRKFEDFSDLVNSVLRLRSDVNGVVESVVSIRQQQSDFGIRLESVEENLEILKLNLTDLEGGIRTRDEDNERLKLNLTDLEKKIHAQDEKLNFLYGAIDRMGGVDLSLNGMRQDIEKVNERINKLTSTTLFVRAVRSRIYLRMRQLKNKIKG